jgi:hypothetical protein
MKKKKKIVAIAMTEKPEKNWAKLIALRSDGKLYWAYLPPTLSNKIDWIEINTEDFPKE